MSEEKKLSLEDAIRGVVKPGTDKEISDRAKFVTDITNRNREKLKLENKELLTEVRKSESHGEHHDAFKKLGLKYSHSDHDPNYRQHNYHSDDANLTQVHKGIEKLGYKYDGADHERDEDSETTHALHYYSHKTKPNHQITVVHDTRGYGGVGVSHAVTSGN